MSAHRYNPHQPPPPVQPRPRTVEDLSSEPAHARRKLISEDEVTQALATLHGTADDIGAARADQIRTEYMLGVTESEGMKLSLASSMDKRKADARTTEHYLEALERAAEAAGRFEALRARRTACQMTIEAWRTMEANDRGARVS